MNSPALIAAAAADSSAAWTWIAILAFVGLGLAGYLWQREQIARRRGVRDPYTEGLNHMLAGRLSEAVEALTQAAAANTNNIDAYIKVGSLYRQLGRARRAVQIHYELTIRTTLSRQIRAAIYRELALDLEQTGNITRAYKCLEDSRKLDPNCPDDLIIKLRLLEKEGRWSDAGDTQKKLDSVRGRPDHAKLALYKIQEGEAQCAAGKRHDGRVSFKEALKLDSGAAEAMLYIADSYTREGREQDALEWMSKFITENPDRAELAIPMLERLLFEAGRFGEVEPIVRKAVEKAPENRHLIITLIDLLTRKGEADEALDWCDRLLELNPHDTNVNLYRLQLLRRTGDERALDRSLDELIALAAPYGQGYYCHKCSYNSVHLRSRCPRCGEWRTFFGDRRT